MDINSFIYWAKGCDTYELLRCHSNTFNMSGYKIDNPYGIVPANSKVIVLMKDQANGVQIVEFAGLHSKMYTYCTERGDTLTRTKGVQCMASRTLMVKTT